MSWDWLTDFEARLEEAENHEILFEALAASYRPANEVAARWQVLTDEGKRDLLDKLLDFLVKFKKKLDEKGKEWGVESYTVGASLGIPPTFDLSLTFKT